MSLSRVKRWKVARIFNERWRGRDNGLILRWENGRQLRIEEQTTIARTSRKLDITLEEERLFICARFGQAAFIQFHTAGRSR